jgi:hypothetical protein
MFWNKTFSSTNEGSVFLFRTYVSCNGNFSTNIPALSRTPGHYGLCAFFITALHYPYVQDIQRFCVNAGLWNSLVSSRLVSSRLVSSRLTVAAGPPFVSGSCPRVLAPFSCSSRAPINSDSYGSCSSLYNLGTDPTENSSPDSVGTDSVGTDSVENTASHNFSIVPCNIAVP